jgi:hypothetical protein
VGAGATSGLTAITSVVTGTSGMSELQSLQRALWVARNLEKLHLPWAAACSPQRPVSMRNV